MRSVWSMSRVKAEFSIGLPRFLPRARAAAARARMLQLVLKICVETYFFVPDTFAFLQFGQIQPPSSVFAELKLSGLYWSTLRTLHTDGHHKLVPTPTQLS